jgi:molybdopterin-guanine dinucleotide biosynthesis protein A
MFEGDLGCADRYAGQVLFDAVILAGGRSSRLGGEPKPALRFRGHSLLEQTVAAADGARTIVVVGEDPRVDFGVVVHFVREDPPFGGPAAGIAAGLHALVQLDGEVSEFTLVLACDMPEVASAVRVLLGYVSASEGASDGVVARDSQGRDQPLAALYRSSALKGIVADLAATGGAAGLSVRSLISRLKLDIVSVPEGSTDDIDTWADAERQGVTRP